MWIAIAAGCLVLTIGNSVVTVRLWRSQMYDRPQQIVQTAMLWLLPGFVIVVNWILRESSRKESSTDPTFSNEGATDYGKQVGGGYH
jgi:cytochrome c-type biogenesis protein CcmH/NrfF